MEKQAVRTVHAGLGLGLAIARQLTELHGGVMTAESGGPGTGALFRVELPLRADVAVPERKEAAADYGLARLMGVRALVVDDKPDAREIPARSAHVTPARPPAY